MRPTDRLERSIQELTATLMAWPAFVAAIRARTHDGYPSTTGGGGSSGGEIPNPTFNAVVARQRWVDLWEEVDGLANNILSMSSRIAAATSQLKEAEPSTPQRCTGAPSEPWGDPTCERLAVASGLCWACIGRRKRYRADREEELA